MNINKYTLLQLKRLRLLCGLIFVSFFVSAQKTITLEECLDKSLKNYPLTKQRELIARSGTLLYQNATKSSLPQANIFGQASYQSAVTAVPSPMPGIDLPLVSKDQYKLYLDLQQPLYDGGYTNAQKHITTEQNEVEKQKLETELYKLNERVQQIYFAVLLTDIQLKQIALSKEDATLNLQRVQALVNNGVSLKSNADLLKAEILRIEQKEIELHASRDLYFKMLSLFINEPIDASAELKTPTLPETTTSINRPEVKLFESQSRQIEAQNRVLKAKNHPRVNFFFQGGIGRPALNMLSNDFEPYYIMGLRLNWSITALYTKSNEKNMIKISRDNIDLQKEAFLFNTKMAIEQDLSDAAKFKSLIQKDQAMLELRQSIRLAAKAQLENGTMNSADYLREAHAEEIARETIALHEIQLLMSHYTQQIHAGKN